MKKTPIFDGRIISLALEEHPLPDGRSAGFEIVRHSGGAAVLPLLPDGRVVLIRQFRPAAGGIIIEVPAGRIEPGELPEACVLRELREESGYLAGRLEKLGAMLPTPGYCDEIIHLFVATDLEPVGAHPEQDEFLEVLILPFGEALEMVRAGRIPDGKTQLALLLYSLRS